MRVDFIDTNVFIYLFDKTAQEKQETSRNLIRKALPVCQLPAQQRLMGIICNIPGPHRLDTCQSDH